MSWQSETGNETKKGKTRAKIGTIAPRPAHAEKNPGGYFSPGILCTQNPGMGVTTRYFDGPGLIGTECFAGTIKISLMKVNSPKQTDLFELGILF
jgi:hypothetical protein